MTIAIKRSNGELIWFDAVTSYGRQFKGAVSKHPLEDGAVITDHTTIDNEVIKLNGILSDIDFNLDRPTISSQDAQLLGIQSKQFVNNTPVTEGTDGSQIYQNVYISTKPNVSTKLPESIGQFFGANSPTVSVPAVPKVKPADKIKNDLISMFDSRELFSLLDFVDSKLTETLDNCVLTALGFNEDPESGDAVYPMMQIERVKFATSTAVRIKKRVSGSVAGAAADQTNKGKQSATGTTKTGASESFLLKSTSLSLSSNKTTSADLK